MQNVEKRQNEAKQDKFVFNKVNNSFEGVLRTDFSSVPRGVIEVYMRSN